MRVTALLLVVAHVVGAFGVSPHPRLAALTRRRMPPLAASSAAVDPGDHQLRKNVELYEKYGRLGPEEPMPSAAVPVHAAVAAVSSSSPYGVKPEVLSPAGGWPQLKAAVANGADACYFGLQEGFNARARASNFAIDELPEVMTYLHQRGCKGYLVVNILVFDEEMARLEPLVRRIAAAGVDALIMQDMGAVELVRTVAPNLPVHGSTQMSITDAPGARFAADRLGIDRVVVGRELSVEEIAAVGKSGVEVEAFVHGALCVSYSGQCFSSEAWGGRSANRGQCAQACRMPYGLVLNGSLVAAPDDAKYLLSPQDLSAIDLVPELIVAGVKSFKIEGRLKGPEYAAITTKAYRLAVDAAWEQLHQQLPPSHAPAPAPAEATATASKATAATPTLLPKKAPASAALRDKATAHFGSASVLDAQLRRDLKQVFSRGQDGDHDGLSAGFLRGPRHQSLVRGRSPRHRGLFVGTVVGFVSSGVASTAGRAGAGAGAGSGGGGGHGGGVVVELAGPVKRGDGLVFDRGLPEEAEEGGAVYEVWDPKGRPVAKGAEPDHGTATLFFARGAVAWARVRPGDLVWRNKDPALDARLKALTTKGDLGVCPVHCRVTGTAGEPLSLALSTAPFAPDGAATGPVALGQTESALVAAASRPLGPAEVAAAVGTLGDTPFRLTDGDTVDNDGGSMSRLDTSGLAPGLFVPAKEIKEARRTAVTSLLALLRAHDRAAGLRHDAVLPGLRAAAKHTAATVPPAATATSAVSTTTTVAGPAEGEGHDAHGGGAVSASGPQWSLLCRTPAQVAAACAVPWLGEVVLDFLEVKASGKTVVVATPRVIKPGEERLFTFYLRLQPHALLVRSAGFLNQLLALGGPGAVLPQSGVTVPELRGDFSLNAANVVSAGVLLATGLSRLAPTHDLNAAQIAQLAGLLGPAAAGRLEAIVHQHLAVFHTEHCVFCRFLSDGNSFKDCGHPCETSHVALRDVDGQDHLVLADMGCRNTVFSAKAQSGAPFLADWLRAGIRHYRVELVDERAADVAPLLEHYRALGDALWAAPDRGCGPVPDPAADTALRALWAYVEQLPTGPGRGAAQGVATGSLEPQAEMAWKDMKKTARR